MVGGRRGRTCPVRRVDRVRVDRFIGDGPYGLDAVQRFHGVVVMPFVPGDIVGLVVPTLALLNSLDEPRGVFDDDCWIAMGGSDGPFMIVTAILDEQEFYSFMVVSRSGRVGWLTFWTLNGIDDVLRRLA